MRLAKISIYIHEVFKSKAKADLSVPVIKIPCPYGSEKLKPFHQKTKPDAAVVIITPHGGTNQANFIIFAIFSSVDVPSL